MSDNNRLTKSQNTKSVRSLGLHKFDHEKAGISSFEHEGKMYNLSEFDSFNLDTNTVTMKDGTSISLDDEVHYYSRPITKAR